MKAAAFLLALVLAQGGARGGANLLKNGSLDAWFEGAPVGWVPVVLVTGISEGTGTECHAGSCAIIGDGDALYQDVTVEAGDKLLLAGWLRSPACGPVTPAVVVRNHQTGQYLNSLLEWTPSPAAVFTACGDAGAGSYVNRSVAFNVEDDCPAGCTLRVTLTVTGNAGYFDGFFLGR